VLPPGRAILYGGARRWILAVVPTGCLVGLAILWQLRPRPGPATDLRSPTWEVVPTTAEPLSRNPRSPALRRALAHRDGGCRFPGCNLTFCDAHHVEHWADGGETKLDNLVQLRRRHHRAVHEEGYTVELGAGSEAVFRKPDGRVIPDAPPQPSVQSDPVSELEALLAADGIEIDARAS